MSEITAHIATCNDCLDAVASTMRFRREEGMESPAEHGWGAQKGTRMAAAAAVIVALVGLAAFRIVLRGHPEPAMLEQLAAAAPRDYRIVQPRLTQFAFAPLRQDRAGTPNSLATADPAYLKLAGIAGEAIRKGDDPTADAAHAAGVGKLLLRDPAAAVAHLETAAHRSPDDAQIWSDLAAARLDRALQQRRPDLLPLALDAANRSVALAPTLAPARFNLALILEQLGLRSDAVDAWRRYLEIERDAGWRDEANGHLQRLQAIPTPISSGQLLDAIETAAASNDAAALARLVDPRRREARAACESTELGRWGAAYLAGNLPLARRKLAASRQVGELLCTSRGECLLRDAVRSIDGASPEAISRLAEAHQLYDAARVAYSLHQLQKTDLEFDHAALQFRQAGSPMANVAHFYGAAVARDQNRIADAQSRYEQLLAGDALRQAGYLALDAQTHSELGLCYGYGGRWEDAVRFFSKATETFAAIGEPGYQGDAESKLAEAYDRLARPDRAWQHRVTSFGLLSSHPVGGRLLATLVGAVSAETRAGHAGGALSFLTLELAEAKRTGDALSTADVLRRRALLLSQRGETAQAWASLRESRSIASRQDPSMAARLDAENDAAQAVLLRGTDPRRAIDLLTSSIAFFEKSGQLFSLPDAYLERASAERLVREPAAAARDLERGIAALESQRAASHDAELRATLFDEGAGLFEEGVDLLVSEGDGERAFAYSERARARLLLDRRAGTAPAAVSVAAISRALPADAALVEWMLTRESIVAFVITSRGMQIAHGSATRTAAETEIRKLRMAIEQRFPVDELRREAAALDAILLAPVRAVLGETPRAMIMVPDRSLEAVPWAALCAGTNGRWLIEQTELTIAPSAEVWLRDSRRDAVPLSSPSILVISSSGGGTTEHLGQADDEARAVAWQYPRATVLASVDATAQRFLNDCSRYDVIHFCGHAEQGDDATAALLFAPAGAGSNDALTAQQISRQHLDRTRLVVLAACATAGGTEERLEGIPTLARAFLTAGAPAVVASLWPIEDEESAIFSVEFHRALRKSGRPAQAVRDAQRFMIASDRQRLRHPAAWAGIALLGSSTPL